MRRALRVTWHSTSIALAVVALSLAFAHLHGIDLRFSRHRQAWQLACSDGRLRFGNAPQIALEAKQIQEARDERARDNEAREAETRHILRQAPWRSPAYQAALIKLKELKEGEAALAAQDEAELAASRSQPIEHSVPLRPLILIAGAVPVVWLITMLIALRRRLKRAGWTRRQVASTALAALSALLFFAVAFVWIRSYFVIEAAYYITQEPQRSALVSTSIYAYDGNLIFRRQELSFVNQKIYERELGGRATFVPKPSEEPSAPGLWHRSTIPVSSRRASNPPFWRRFDLSFSTRSYAPTRGNIPAPWDSPVLTLAYISVPIWLLMLISAIWPILWLRKMRRHIFAGPNRCRGCGYDLRASPDRCPECGLVRAAATQVA